MDAIYNAATLTQAKPLLDKYHVAYVVIGYLELQKYGGLEDRPFAAAEYYRDGLVKKILVSNPRESPSERLFETVASCCALVDGDRAVVAHQRGLDTARLHAAGADPALAGVLRSATLQVLAPGTPGVASLGRTGDWAAVVPLLAGGHRLGQLVLFLRGEPAPGTQGLLTAFATRRPLVLGGWGKGMTPTRSKPDSAT